MRNSCTMRAMFALSLVMTWITVEPSLANNENKDLAFLLNEVDKITAPGVPGPLCVFGEQGFPAGLNGEN